MDFWSRLIAGTSLSPAASQKAAANNPEKRLARFRKEFNHLLHIWRGASILSKDVDATESIRNSLQELTTILSDESRRPLPHPCIAFAAAKQIYIPVSKIAALSYNEGIIREGVGLFATLIDSEEEDFVENEGFSSSLMNLLVKITGVNSIRLTQETEVEIVELSFNITTKIRLDPEILPVWFTAQEREEPSDEDEPDEHEKFTGKSHKEDFPLFYLLIDYIHDEGRIGDFARTGLLYIIEAASNSVALEQWIVESDLATMMATGLGALYSQLSRKLVIDHLPHELPPVLALSDYEHPIATTEIVSSVDLDFQNHMETFLSHLVFWQDVLNHCKSMEVKHTLLEHFQVIFLQQLLYPSLLESSDVDGGSSVAVLTYLRRILESLDHPDMIHLILHYLLALPDSTPAPTGSRASVSAARKRKSMDLATIMAAQLEDSATPALFNLVDLIQDSLKSENQQTVSVTLQLVSAILRRHHRYAVTTLLWTSHVVSDRPQRTIGAHESELDFILTLAGEIGTDDNIDEVYDNHVKDCMSILESHPCSIPLVAPRAFSGPSKLVGAQATIPGAPRDIRPHTLRPEDPMLKTLLSILSNFFINSVETNLSLTGTIVDLAACGFMRVECWLVPDPEKYPYEEPEELEDPYLEAGGDSIEAEERTHMRALRNSRRRPKWDEVQLPAILAQLKVLVEQACAYRNDIPRFDEILKQRREAFQTASSAVPTPASTPHPPHLHSEDDIPPSRSASPPRPSPLDSLAQRLFDKIESPSRSGSPRGRRSQEQPRSSGHTTSTSMLNEIYAASSPVSRSSHPGSQSMLSPESPSRGSSRAFSPSPLRINEREGNTHLSQAAVYAAVDQTILARKVGLPKLNRNFEKIPFPDLRASDGGFEAQEEESKKGSDDEEDTTSDAVVQSVDKKVSVEEETVSVSHILTNTLVLQEFLLELAALIQVRAGLFGEIKFV